MPLIIMIVPFFNNTMNTTIRYWVDNQQCKYMSLPTYQKALDMVRLLSQIDIKAEVKLY